MRPNLALGPIDSVLQYLVYLSIVVLGVLLPLLVQKWRVRRENARLLAQTLSALRRELLDNRQRLLKSRASMTDLLAVMRDEYQHYERLWHRVHDAAGAVVDVSPPVPSETAVSLAAPTSTAWDVARLSQSLRLLSAEQLSVFTRAYHLQSVHEESRRLYLDNTFKSQALETPLDLSDLRNIETRIQLIAVSQAVVSYHENLLGTLIAAYDLALADSAIAPTAASDDTQEAAC
ncbi:MAG: hypothetical protein ABI777_04710 [Betaproteobacteria bacterium]